MHSDMIIIHLADFCVCNLSKGPGTRADKMKLSVHLGKILVKKLVGLNCTDKLHSVRLLTIWYLLVRCINKSANSGI